MSVIIRLQNLPWSASSADIRRFFQGLTIPGGGVHIVGGDEGDAFIAFATDEDARQAMRLTGEPLNGVCVKLFLSSRSEMQQVINKARGQPAPVPAAQPPTPPAAAPPIPNLNQIQIPANLQGLNLGQLASAPAPQQPPPPQAAPQPQQASAAQLAQIAQLLSTPQAQQLQSQLGFDLGGLLQQMNPGISPQIQQSTPPPPQPLLAVPPPNAPASSTFDYSQNSRNSGQENRDSGLGQWNQGNDNMDLDSGSSESKDRSSVERRLRGLDRREFQDANRMPQHDGRMGHDNRMRDDRGMDVDRFGMRDDRGFGDHRMEPRPDGPGFGGPDTRGPPPDRPGMDRFPPQGPPPDSRGPPRPDFGRGRAERSSFADRGAPPGGGFGNEKRGMLGDAPSPGRGVLGDRPNDNRRPLLGGDGPGGPPDRFGGPPHDDRKRFGGPPPEDRNRFGGPPPPQEERNRFGGPPPPQEERNRFGGPPPPQEERNRFGGPPPPQEERNRFGGPPPPPEERNRFGGPPPPQDERNRFGGPPPPQEERNRYGGPPPEEKNRFQQGPPPQEERNRFNQPPADSRFGGPPPDERGNRFSAPPPDNVNRPKDFNKARNRFGQDARRGWSDAPMDAAPEESSIANRFQGLFENHEPEPPKQPEKSKIPSLMDTVVEPVWGRNIPTARTQEQKPSPVTGRCVLISNMPKDIPFREVKRFFNVEIPRHGLKFACDANNEKTGLAYIRFATIADCQLALKDNKIAQKDARIVIKPCSEQEFELATEAPEVPHDKPEIKSPPSRKEESPRRGGPRESDRSRDSGRDRDRDRRDRRDGDKRRSRSRSPRRSRDRDGRRSERSSDRDRRSDSDRSDRDRRRRDDESKRESRPEETSEPKELCLGVKNLPPKLKIQDIVEFFKGLKLITNSVYIEYDAKGACVGPAYMEFADKEDFKKALSYSKKLLISRYVEIEPMARKEIETRVREHKKSLMKGRDDKDKESSKKKEESREETKSDEGPPPIDGPFIEGQDQKLQPPTSKPANVEDLIKEKTGSESMKDVSEILTGVPGDHENLRISAAGIPWKTTPEEIVAWFDGVNIVPGSMIIEPFQHNRKGVPRAFFTVETEEDLKKALAKHKQYMGNRYISIWHWNAHAKKNNPRQATQNLPAPQNPAELVQTPTESAQTPEKAVRKRQSRFDDGPPQPTPPPPPPQSGGPDGFGGPGGPGGPDGPQNRFPGPPPGFPDSGAGEPQRNRFDGPGGPFDRGNRFGNIPPGGPMDRPGGPDGPMMRDGPQRFGEPPARMDGPPPRFDGPPQRFDGPPGRFDGPPGRFDGPPGRFDGPASRFDGPPERFDGPPSMFGDGPPPRFDGPPDRFDGPPSRFNDGGPPMNPFDDDRNQNGRPSRFDDGPRDRPPIFPDGPDRDRDSRERDRGRFEDRGDRRHHDDGPGDRARLGFGDGPRGRRMDDRDRERDRDRPPRFLDGDRSERRPDFNQGPRGRFDDGPDRDRRRFEGRDRFDRPGGRDSPMDRDNAENDRFRDGPPMDRDRDRRSPNRDSRDRRDGPMDFEFGPRDFMPIDRRGPMDRPPRDFDRRDGPMDGPPRDFDGPRGGPMDFDRPPRDFDNRSPRDFENNRRGPPRDFDNRDEVPMDFDGPFDGPGGPMMMFDGPPGRFMGPPDMMRPRFGPRGMPPGPFFRGPRPGPGFPGPRMPGNFPPLPPAGTPPILSFSEKFHAPAIEPGEEAPPNTFVGDHTDVPELFVQHPNWQVVKVARLPYKMPAAQLFDLFKAFNPVENSAYMRVNNEGMYCGDGCLAFESKEDAARAVKEKDGEMFGRKPMKVYLFTNQKPQGQGKGEGQKQSQSQSDGQGQGENQTETPAS